MLHRGISYSDARTFCDIDSEYPEAAFNTVKVGIMMNGLIQMVCLRISIYDIIIIAISIYKTDIVYLHVLNTSR